MRTGRDSKIEVLRQVPLFAHCSKRELTKVASIADEIDVPEGKPLTREGKRGQEFFLVLEGTAVVRRKGRRIRSLGPGDFLGEIALLTQFPRTATVTATSPVRVLVVTARAFRSLLRDSPGIQRKVLETLAGRLAPETL